MMMCVLIVSGAENRWWYW